MKCTSKCILISSFGFNLSHFRKNKNKNSIIGRCLVKMIALKPEHCQPKFLGKNQKPFVKLLLLNIFKLLFHKIVNKCVCCGLFQMVSSFPVSESLLQAPSFALLDGTRKRETAGLTLSKEQGFLA